MSKTDKTKPVWVKMRDGDAPVREVHDHRKGECDLPAEPPKGEYPHGTRGTTRCYWATGWDGTNFGCGCAMCTAQAERKQENRARRHGERKDINERLED